MKTYGGEWGIAPLSLDLRTSWRKVASFTSQPLCPRGGNLYASDRRLGAPQMNDMEKRYLLTATKYASPKRSKYLKEINY
jgi:hypothetical protein